MNRFAFPDLARAFHDAERFGDATMRVLEADHLVLPTGRIVACDPTYLMNLAAEQRAYTRAVPPGRYPVLVALLGKDGFAADHPNRESVACAAVRFHGTPVERWEMALRSGWDPSTLKPGFYFGYGVDGGTGCFVDECAVQRLPSTQPAFHAAFQLAHAKLGAVYQAASLVAQGNASEAMRRTLADPRYQEWQQEMLRAYELMEPPGLGEVLRLDRIRLPAWSAVLDPQSQANIVCFRSGEGDGSYPSYFGLGADGTPACLVTDFGLLVRSIMGTLEVAVPARVHNELTHPDFAAIGIDCIHVEWQPDKGEMVVDIGDALYVAEVRFENRPGSPSRCTCVAGCAWSFHLGEPLQPTARVLIEYTLRTVAL
jgi:hypothetical protein